MLDAIGSGLRSRLAGGLVDRIRLTLAVLAFVNVLAGGVASAALAADGWALTLTILLALWIVGGSIRERVPPGAAVVEAALLGGHLALTGSVDLALAPFYTTMLFRAAYDDSARPTVIRSVVYFAGFAIAYIVGTSQSASVLAVFLSAHAAAFVAVPLLSVLLIRSLADQDRAVGELRVVEGARADAMHALEMSEQRFRGLFEGSGVGIAITEVTGRFVDANDAYQHLLGYTVEELRATDFLTVTHPDDRDPNSSHVQALLAGQVPNFTFEKRYLAKSGDTVWARVTVSLIRDTSGRPLHIAAMAEDITTAKRADERLRRSERLRRLAGQLALVGGWSIEADDLTLYWSDEIFRILDVPDDEEPPLDVALDLYPPEHREPLGAAIQACLQDGTPFDMELEINTLAGRRIPVRAIAEAERDEQGRVVRVIGAFQDVTELHRVTHTAREAARRLTATLESMTDAFYTLDRDWRFEFVNQRAGQLLRRDPDELIGTHFLTEFPEAVDTDLSRAYRAAMESGQTHVLSEFYYPPLDTWFEINAYPSNQGLAVYFRDVSAVRAARLELLERERTLQQQAALLDEAQDAILVRDLDHRITYWNASAQRVYGWSADEAVGQNVRSLLGHDLGAFDAATAELLERGAWTGDLVQQTRDGGRVVVAGRWSLLYDDEGEPQAILAINTDVTEQRQIERQFLRAQRMESIGTLASGVAHDLNNILSPIQLAAELLQLTERPTKEQELLTTITTSARRGADLVSQVLSFARGVDGERAPIDIGRVLSDVRAIVRDTFPRSIDFELHVDDMLPTVLGDSTQIQQVLLNLAVNARDAMPNGGVLAFRATTMIIDAAYATVQPLAAPGSYLVIEVEDTGTGMPPDVRDRVFEPFFTTKPHGAGTGLGLSTSAGIISSHGGWVNVYSEPGTGTRFRVYLPAISGGGAAVDAGEPATSAGRSAARGDGRTILVVDDEASVRAMTRQTLEAHGYRVVEAANGAEAVSRFVDPDHRFDLVLTDMMMPVMDGPATIRALLTLDPHIRIVGASGLHGNGKVAEAAAAGILHFIPKPYTALDLLQTVASALGVDVDDPDGI